MRHINNNNNNNISTHIHMAAVVDVVQANIDGLKIYQKFQVVVELTEILRQQNIGVDDDQRKFIELLPRLRVGKSTINDSTY